MLTVGLTGGIAGGKSTVARLLEARGAVTVDTDQLAHEIMNADPDLRRALGDRFGEGILTEAGVNRRALGDVVFGRPECLEALNKLVHPPVIERVAGILAAWRLDPPAEIGIVQVPLLVEAGMAEMFDAVVVIVSSPEQQIRRLLEAGFTEGEALARLRSQMADWQRLPYADLTLVNKGNLHLLEEQTEILWRELRTRAAQLDGSG